jgi:ribonuclease P protein component
MLSKKYKLSDSSDFKKVQTDGKVYQSKNFGIAYLKRDDNEVSRFAFIVSTKISKDAVDRNRFKRTMSDAVRLNTIHLLPGFNVVFLAKTTIVNTPASELMKEVDKGLKESGISN